MDHIRRRVEQLVESEDKKLLIEQLSSFCHDVHHLQALCRSITSGRLLNAEK